MKLQILFVFVLSVHLVLGKNTRSLTNQEVSENPSEQVRTAECTDYMFRVTSTKLPFSDARAECIRLGGDILQSNFGPDGSQYHDEIHRLALQYSDAVGGPWIGYTDLGKEGTWRFLNGQLYDANFRGQSAVAYWANGEPNVESDAYTDCAQFWLPISTLEIDDYGCYQSNYGLCEIKYYIC